MSTVPATAGQTVGLFLRERALPFTLEQHSPHVVLMVHGGFAPSVVAYDLQYRQRMDAWNGLRVDHKLFIKVACASHFMQFERARHLLRRATVSWLANGSVDGMAQGEFYANAAGTLGPLQV